MFMLIFIAIATVNAEQVFVQVKGTVKCSLSQYWDGTIMLNEADVGDDWERLQMITSDGDKNHAARIHKPTGDGIESYDTTGYGDDYYGDPEIEPFLKISHNCSTSPDIEWCNIFLGQTETNIIHNYYCVNLDLDLCLSSGLTTDQVWDEATKDHGFVSLEEFERC